MADGLWSAQRRALTGGLVLTITFVAAEALAVVTVMPVVARDLHGLELYGFVFSAFLLGTMVGIVAAGRAADQRGPAVPYIAGLIVFVVGLTIAGLAPSMPVLVAGRALQGLGAGAVPSVAYAAIGRTLPDHLRARMMAIMSTAWVVPGLAGPAISAEVAHLFGWRWVFLGLLPFIALTGPFAIPALLKLGRPENKATEGHRLIDGVGVAAAAGLVLGGLTLAAGSSSTAAGGAAARPTGPGRSAVAAAGSHPVAVVARATGGGFSGRDLAIVVGGVLILAGLALGVPLLRRLMPPGTLRARYGLPATIASRSLLTFAFFGADAFVTLTITILRHYTPVVAGIAVTGSTLAWTTGAWFQAKMNGKWPSRRLVRLGLSIILVGIAGLTLLLSSHVSVAEGIAAWTVAGLGMGMTYSPITLLMMQAAPAGGEGWASASLNLADVLGSAMGIGIGGALISAAVTLGWSLAVGLAAAFALTAAAAVIGLLISRQLPDSRPQPPAEVPGLKPADNTI
ncbi:MAG TPA: MFS transporter [Streptosporangiaceae bacterium]|jgi:MFS family permease